VIPSLAGLSIYNPSNPFAGNLTWIPASSCAVGKASQINAVLVSC
jgi:hypothetical protein